MLRHHRTTFVADQRGNVAMLFGLALLPLMAMCGMAIDYARAVSYEARVQIALDAAALSATKALVESSASEAQLADLAAAYFDKAVSNLDGWHAKRDDLKIEIDRENGIATVSVKGAVDTTIARIFKVEKIDVEASASAEFRVKDIELGVMLDVSGSMGGEKLEDLKQANRDLFDQMLDNKPAGRKVRIGLAPYSTSVNAGDYAEKAKGNSGQGNADTNKCVSERKGKDGFTDEPPKNGKQFGGKPVECPVNSVLALTDSKAELLTSLDAYVADGMTAGHLGIAWAWYLVSPKWKDFWPVKSAPDPADSKRNIKAVVIMTDGMFNQEYELEDNGTSADQAKKLCDNIKDENVVVFTVGFQAPPEVIPVLQGCATKPDYAFDAANGEALKAAFSEIARNLNELRITQ